MTETAAIMDIPKETLLKSAIKAPTLFIMSAETLNQNVEQSSQLLGIDKQQYIQMALKAPNLFYQLPEVLNSNIEKSAELLKCKKEEMVEKAKIIPSIISYKPESVFERANIYDYYKQIKETSSGKLIDSVNNYSTEYLYGMILKYLIGSHNGQLLQKGNPQNVVIKYLKEHPEENFVFKIPAHEKSEELIKYAQKLSQEVLGKQVFSFIKE